MKNTILLLVIMISCLNAQNWITTGGNPQRNGLTEMTGPTDVSQTYWTITASNSLWGNSVFTYGDKFVTSRVVFSPVYSAKIECRSLTDGSLYWEKTLSDTSIMYVVGFNEFGVYAHDYETGILYSLSPEDGSVNWSIVEDMFGGKSGLNFTSNGDPVIKGKRLDKYTGEVLWNYNYIIPVGPDASYVLYGDTYYHWTGSITTPKKIFALDAETGAFKYESEDLAGDGDQEYPLTIGDDGTIYIPRDGGPLYAVEDNGTGLIVKWTYNPITEVKGYFGSDSAGNMYIIDAGRIRHLNKNDGTVIDTSLIEVTTGFLPSITVDAAGNVYVGTADAGTGKYYCLSSDLQTLHWEMAVPYNYYAGPSLGKEGVMVLIGSGNQINSYKTNELLKPVADFYVDTLEIFTGNAINFFDQSSYMPDSWQWHFEGAETETSTEQNPQNIIYNQAGTFSVKLIVSNSLGADSLIKESYITVEQLVNVSDNETVPDGYALQQNYPNPFNPSTKIEYQIPVSNFVSIKVYDVLGNEMSILVNEEKPAGSYTLSFDASALPSGVYYYTIKAGEFISTKKMMVVK